MNVNLYKNIFETNGSAVTITVNEALNRIKNGTSAKKVEWIRKVVDKEKKQQWKKKLPGVTFSGTFEKREDDKLLQHSNFICLDFDNVADVEKYKQQLSEWMWTHAVWKSPSGTGLKCLVKIVDGIRHKEHFAALRQIWPEADEQCGNPSRICFESYDPDIYINENAWTFEDVEEPETKILFNENIKNIKPNETYLKLLKWINKKEVFDEGNRNHYVFKLAGACCRYGISEEETFQLIIVDYADDDFTEKEITATIKSAYRQNKEQFNTQRFETDKEFIEPPKFEKLLPNGNTDYEKRIINSSQLSKYNRTGLKFFLEPLIPAQSMWILAGPGGCGKSLLLQNLSIDLALGKNKFLGFKLKSEYKKVLYVSTEETNKDKLSYYMNQQLAKSGVIGDDFFGIDYLLAGFLEPSEILDEIHSHLQKEKCSLIIIDSLGDLCPHLNDNSAMRQFFKPYDQICQLFNCCIAFIHHYNKASLNNDNYSVQGVMGAGSITNKTRCSFKFWRDKQSGLRYLRQIKTNANDEFLDKNIELAFDKEFFTFSTTGEINSLNTRKKDRKSELHELAQAIFKNSELRHKEFSQLFCELTSQASAEAGRTLLEMAELGVIVKTNPLNKRSPWKQSEFKNPNSKID